MISKAQAERLLPSQKSSLKVDPARLKYLLISEPKWGKTTWLMSIPGAVLFAFEEGHQFHSGFKIIIEAWDAKSIDFKPYVDDNGCSHMTLVQAVEAVCASDKFKFVGFDTADMAVKMCLDWHTKRKGVEHISDMEWGKGYDILLADPFRQQVLKLIKSGRGVGFTTHSKNEIARFSDGEKARKEMTLPRSVKQFIVGQADVIGHGEFGRKIGKTRDRVLVLEGTTDTLAGTRAGIHVPSRYVVDEKQIWKQWKSFFSDPAAAKRAEQECMKRSKVRL